MSELNGHAAPDPALGPLAHIVLTADTAPKPSKPSIQQSDSERIIDAMTVTCRNAEQFALQRIDGAIERLQKLRDAVQQKCRANIDWTIEFVQLVDDGMREVARLESSSIKISDAAS